MFKTLDDLKAQGDIAGKVVYVREDLNVPMADGKVSDDTRLRATIPTLQDLSAMGAKILVLAHFGRPKGQVVPEMSLRPVAPALAKVLGQDVGFMEQPTKAAIDALANGSVTVVENSRFAAGEEKNDPEMARRLAEFADFYVNDAFSAAHRAHVTTAGLADHLPAFAGRAMEAELKALEAALGNPEKPVAAIVGGAKVSSKLDVLNNLVKQVDHLVIGGGMANTFLAARGINVGKSLCEHDLTDTALAILEAADKSGCTVHLPYDVVVAKDFKAHAENRTVNVHEVGEDEMILDVGASAVEAVSDALKNCKTLIWNGPMGAFEMEPFDAATVALARSAAALAKEGTLIAVAGGGDTVAALNHAGVAGDFSFVSTAGGAFLEWMEGKELPGVAALEKSA